jgi:hypothetical protein
MLLSHPKTATLEKAE